MDQSKEQQPKHIQAGLTVTERLGLSLTLSAMALGLLSGDSQQAPQAYNPYAVLQSSADSAPQITIEPDGSISIEAPVATSSSYPAVTTSGAPLIPPTTSALEPELTTTSPEPAPTTATKPAEPSKKPTTTSSAAPTTKSSAEKSANPEIQQGIGMAPPKRLIVRNPDGTVLVDVTTEPYSGEYQGKDANGVPQYYFDPPVAQHQGDNRANYIDWAGMPNTLPYVTKRGEQVAQQDDNPIIMSHSSNLLGVYLAFQLLAEAKVGATATVTTAKGIFVYKLMDQDDFREILKLQLAGNEFTWGAVKNDLVLVTCLPAVGSDGVRVPADQEKNTVIRMQLVAAKAAANQSN